MTNAANDVSVEDKIKQIQELKKNFEEAASIEIAEAIHKIASAHVYDGVEGQNEVANEALDVLMTGKRDVLGLIAGIGHNKDGMALRALRALSSFKGEEATGHIINIATDPDRSGSKEKMYALDKLGERWDGVEGIKTVVKAAPELLSYGLKVLNERVGDTWALENREDTAAVKAIAEFNAVLARRQSGTELTGPQNTLNL